MRATILAMLWCLPFYFMTARAEDEENPAKEPAAAATTAADKAAEKAVFTPPPGWRAKKRGKFTVYCRKEDVMGSRFPAEKCYDEKGIEEMLRAQEDDQAKVDQMRRVCGSQAACGSR